MPTPPAPAWIEHGLARLQPTELEEAVVGGTERDRHARDRNEIGAVGHRPRQDLGNGHQLRVRAREVGAHDPLPDRAVGDAFADLADRARALVADDVRRRGHLATRTVERVAALDADRLDRDDHTAGIHHRIGDVFVAEDVGRTGLVVHGGFHARTLWRLEVHSNFAGTCGARSIVRWKMSGRP